MPLDWNQMNYDDSQVEGCESDTLDQSSEEDIPKICKTISSPLPQKHKQKLKTSKRPNKPDDIITENLLKLSQIQKDKIWLFVPNHYKDETEEINAILKLAEKIKKINKTGPAWNVLVEKVDAQHLIQNGLRKNNYHLKFYISTKNTQNQSKDPINMFQKQLTSPRNVKRQQTLTNKIGMKYKQKNPRDQEINVKNLRDEECNPKYQGKMQRKYVQKNQIPKKQKQNQQNLLQSNTSKLIIFNLSQSQLKSQIAERQANINKSILISNTKNTHNQISSAKAKNSQNSEKQLRNQEATQNSGKKKVQIGQDMQNAKNTNIQAQQQALSDSDSQESLERMKKELRKKQKKLNKKKQPNYISPKIDSNNPFSLLGKF